MTHPQGKHAIVIGAGISGLCCAEVLTEYFDHVTLVERDASPQGVSGGRKGVPQGRHAHVLLQAGELILEDIFPEIMTELRQQGARRFDPTEGASWFHYGLWKKRHKSGFMIHQQSRPLLENQIVKRLTMNPRLTFLRQYTAKKLCWSDDQQTVTGLVVESTVDTLNKTLDSDLIIDASGRASQLSKWLKAAQYETAKETRVGMDLQYSTRIFQAPATAPDWQAFAVYGTPPKETRSGVILRIEGDKYLVTLVGYTGDYPPKHNDDFLDFAKTLSVPDFYEQIKDLTPLSDVAIHRYPYARQLHFENIKQHPQGIVALGDAVCSFDPVFGQGMTVGLQCVKVLQQELQQRQGKIQAKAFYRRLSKMLFVPWLLASTEDFRYPVVTGKRPFWLGMMQQYTLKVFLLSAKSKFVYLQFTRVFHMTIPPYALFSPAMLWRVFFTR